MKDVKDDRLARLPMGRRKLLKLCAVGSAAGLGLLGGCGGGDDAAATPPTSGRPPLPAFVPGSVSDVDRQAAVATIESLFHSVHGQQGAAAQIVAKMKTMKQFAAAEVGDSGDAIGYFTDGQMYACFTSDRLGTPRLAMAANVAVAPAAARKRRQDLTDAPVAYLVNAFEPARLDVTASVASLLAAKGYQVTLLGGDVSDFQLISKAGLLFVHAHGILARDDAGVDRFWYATSTRKTPELDAAYKAAIDRGTLASGSGDVFQADGSTVTEQHYIVSDQFLHECGMSFADNAVWISQSCSSFNPIALKAFLDPAAGFPGVAVYGGWTKPEDTNTSTPSTAFIFDRMLGINQVQPVDPNDPPPATFGQLKGLMADTFRPGGALGYDESTGDEGPSFFVVQARPGTNVPSIIPIITAAEPDTVNQTLTLSGYFGAPTGEILFSGTPLSVRTWSETSVVVDLPSDPSGTLVAHSLGGASAAGYLLSNSFAYTGLAIGISPPGASLQLSEQKTFTVSVTAGKLPAGATYRYTLTGKGSLAGGSPLTTANNSVGYVAPSVPSSDALKVEVLDASSTVVATAGAVISVGQPTLTYTVTGDVSGQSIPPLADGTLTEPFFASFHVALTGQDNALVEYLDPVTTNSFLLVLTLPAGGKFNVGDAFTYGSTGAGLFHFLPGQGRSNYIFNASNGNLTIGGVIDNGDGTFTIAFSGSVTDFLNCKIAASGSFVFHYSYDTAP